MNAAKMLGVTTDYLLGFTDFPYSKKIKLNEEDLELIPSYSKLNSEGKQAVKSMISGVIANENFIN